MVILLVSNEMVDALNTIATKFFNMYPVNYEICFHQGSSNLHPHHCLIETKVRKTGIHAKVNNKDNHCTCMDCSVQSSCPITTACFEPIIYKQQVIGFVLVTPKKNEEKWLQLHMEKIEGQLQLCSELMSLKLENIQSNLSNSHFKDEINSLFTFVDDSILLVDQDGIIHNISYSLSALLLSNKSEIVGTSISSYISSHDWLEIAKMRVQNEMKINLKLRKSHKGSFLAKIKPILSDGMVISYLIQLSPLETMKEKLQNHRVLYSFNDIKGTSAAIQNVIEVAKRVSPSNSSILLRGESGTGKEIFAQSIHSESNRREGPFIALNCAAIPESLLESELFGHVKGAFTGSNGNRAGRFEMANGGTIFLDEIGDLSLSLQAKLLRVVQERKIERVGDSKSTPVDVRIITATHRNLEELVSRGEFRSDLYFRLNVIPITIPPLRNRREDIPILVEYFLKSFSKQSGKSPKRLSKEVYDILLQYEWSGNIRELQNVVHHFVQLEIGDLVTLKSLPQYLSIANQTDMVYDVSASVRGGSINCRKGHEKDEIIRLLDKFGRHTSGKKKVANEMNISLPTLYRRMNKLKIK